MATKCEKRDIVYYIVDVFGSEKYSGNQLAVFTDTNCITSDEMQQIAHETNFSETTFITGYNLDMNIFDVRIFTPFQEVPFAGHPTLGTAFIANQHFLNGSANNIYLNLTAGKIPVTKIEDILWMNQLQPQFGEQFDIKKIAKVLELSDKDILPDYPIEIVSTGLPFILVPLANLSALKKARYNVTAAENLLRDSKTKEIMVFTRDTYDSSHQIASRVFVPEYGIVEDAATGSANGCLSAYLLKYNVFKTNSIEISVAQGYEINRKSILYHRSKLTNNAYDLNIGGKVISVAEGIWY
jgi:trans-2,3-dihydro-3-hydroxyanthranilate isomerase